MHSEQPPRKLLDRVRDQVRVKHYSYRTEEAYVQWIRRFILFHNKRHPSEMDGDEVNAFLKAARSWVDDCYPTPSEPRLNRV